MHFSKTYSQLLLTLPPDLRENAIEYRQLKKLINQVVLELTSLGLSPEILHQVLQQTQAPSHGSLKGKEKETTYSPCHGDITLSADLTSSLPPTRVAYELETDDDEIHPRLRLWTYAHTDDSSPTATQRVGSNTSIPSSSSSPVAAEGGAHDVVVDMSRDQCKVVESTTEFLKLNSPQTSSETREVVIPLTSDTAFFQSLLHAHHALSAHLVALRNNFKSNLDVLSRNISSSARPMSYKSSFHPYSHTSNPAAVTVSSSSSFSTFSKTDLYAWRDIFQLYIDAEVFESHSEESRGERAVEDAEGRLAVFMQRLSERGFLDGSKLKLSQSKQALTMFLHMNASILNLLKFQFATTEATRKILKKHAKRTALPFTPTIPSPFAITSPSPSSAALVPISSVPTPSLALFLVQAIGQTILPMVPHIDDYACVICTSIAFKPIRLRCGHLFCVRCLVKMQKRGQANCPMCRAPTVLVADRSNVDWALLNFMKDWFPMESKKKLQQNEKEVAQEEMEELGLDASCVIA